VILYVYRISDHEYGAGFGEKACKALGTIVEEWPINSADDARFVARHGTAYWKASDKVSRIAELIRELITLDPTFLEQSVVERLVVVEADKPRKAWLSWLPWFKTAGEST
jgi:hypothetical protein